MTEATLSYSGLLHECVYFVSKLIRHVASKVLLSEALTKLSLRGHRSHNDGNTSTLEAQRLSTNQIHSLSIGSITGVGCHFMLSVQDKHMTIKENKYMFFKSLSSICFAEKRTFSIFPLVLTDPAATTRYSVKSTSLNDMIRK